ncbi:MAG TPA: hypothetical protein VJO53_11665 [Candidatus Acidoferrales bacterium]|nr:hypothetical protein [Candidatus Acidoferrales bacterium]
MAWFKAALLTFLPVSMVFPVLAAARFGPTGPVSAWPILIYAPLAMWMQTRALSALLDLYRHRRDPVLLAILPLGLVSLGTYALSGVLFVFSLPALLEKFPLS